MNLPPAPDTRLPVSFDFDDVLAEAVWPDPGIGSPIPEGLLMLRYYQDEGYRIYVHTSRHWGDAHEIELWLLEQLGLERAMGIQVICGKLLAGLYVDDRGFRFESENVEGEAPQPLVEATGSPSTPRKQTMTAAELDEHPELEPDLWEVVS